MNSLKHVEKCAEEILAEYNIKFPPIDVVRIAKDKGIRDIFTAEFPKEIIDISGFFNPKQAAIFINKKNTKAHQLFTLAHEFGHYILHEDQWSANENVFFRKHHEHGREKDLAEIEADAFAANLLLPKDMLIEYINKDYTLSQLKELFGVSESFLKNRINFLKYSF